jgi:molecular chaperone DnaK
VSVVVDRAVGIDLGTTNSEIALLPPSEREIWIYADRFGRKTVPSALAWDEKTRTFVVGHAARSRRGQTPEPVESIKRKMGQAAKVSVGPEELAPEAVSARILAELRERMREYVATRAKGGEMPIARAVITVPAYFDAPQVEATRHAGELAGLDVIGILQEPTAAAIYHTWRSRLSDGNFLVYDLGGGTFDVSILRCIGGEYQVLAIDGDNYLGGDDFDRRYAEHIRMALVAQGYALDLSVRDDASDRRRFARLVHLAQEIKEALSTAEVLPVNKGDFLEDKSGQKVSFVADVGRTDYESIIADLVETTIACSERALEHSKAVANVGIGDIDHVVLVGGSTRVPLVVRRVTEALCRRSKSPTPLQDEVDTCVALGAAIHAAQLGGLVVADAEKKLRVRFTTPLVCDGPKMRVGFKVEEAPEQTKSVTFWDGERALGEAQLDGPAQEAVRMELALGDAPDTATSLAFQSKLGAPLGELPVTLHRGDLRPRPTALSRASVVAKDISVEVLRAGKRDRRILLARGAGLPASATHLFFTVDQSGAVVLRVLQNRLPIRTLVVEVSKDLPVGSPVEVVLRCDESMRMEATAHVGGHEVKALIEPAQQNSDAHAEVDALLEDAERAARGLWGGHAAGFQREADKLVAQIREALQTDPDKLAALCVRLRHLVEEFRGATPDALVPPMQRFEEVLNQLRRTVYRARAELVGMTREQWEQRIEALDARARRAYDESDGPSWRRCFNEAQALLETATQEEFAAIRLDDPAYVARRLVTVSAWANSVERDVLDYVPAAADEVRAIQLKERQRVLAWFKADVAEPLARLREEKHPDPNDARRRIESAAAELERIEAAIQRIGSLGLVTDRGGGG